MAGISKRPARVVYPTANQVAHVIVAAARETKSNPFLISGGDAIPIRQCRAYARIALRQLFPSCPGQAIGRMTGCGATPFGFRWFDKAALDRIVEAGRLADAPTPASAPSPMAGAPMADSPPIQPIISPTAAKLIADAITLAARLGIERTCE